MAWGPIISSNWIKTKPTHRHRNLGLICRSMPNWQCWGTYDTKHITRPYFFKFFLQRKTASAPSPCCSDLSFPNLGRTQLTWSLPTLLLPPGIWIAAMKPKKTGHLLLRKTQPSHCINNSSLFSARDELFNHKTRFCCLNSVETVDISSWKRCVFSTCPNITVSISALQPVLLTWKINLGLNTGVKYLKKFSNVAWHFNYFFKTWGPSLSSAIRIEWRYIATEFKHCSELLTLFLCCLYIKYSRRRNCIPPEI